MGRVGRTGDSNYYSVNSSTSYNIKTWYFFYVSQFQLLKSRNNDILLHNKSQCDTLKWTNEGSIM